MLKKAPNTRRNLDIAILRIAKNEPDAVKLRVTMANVVVAQMMPEGVVKGGSSLKMRFGDAATRFTTDFDTARSVEIDDFIAMFAANLSQGWNGFTGRIVRCEPASPEGVPAQYVMQPFDVKLDYYGRSWCTVGLEVGYDEIGDADEPEYILDQSVIQVFRELSIPDPEPVPLMPLHHQIAQKLHGASEVDSLRAHDLIDLQIIVSNADVDWARTRETCIRLFANRKEQTWPPTIVRGKNWGESYMFQAAGLDVIQDVDAAIVWVNELIAFIDSQ